MWRRLSDRIKGKEASLAKWLNKSRSHGIGLGFLMASSQFRAKKLQKKHPVVWHSKRPTSSSDTARARKKSSGVNCRSRKVINSRYDNCYRLTIMNSLSRYIKVNAQLLFYTVVMHHCCWKLSHCSESQENALANPPRSLCPSCLGSQLSKLEKFMQTFAAVNSPRSTRRTSLNGVIEYQFRKHQVFISKLTLRYFEGIPGDERQCFSQKAPFPAQLRANTKRIVKSRCSMTSLGNASLR